MKYKKINNFITPKYNIHGVFLRPICSFVCRNSRLKKSNIDNIKKYWPYMGVNFETRNIDLNNFFSIKNMPVILDIGFGNGESLIHTAYSNPNKNIIGIEVYIPGISVCMKNIYINKIKNIKIIMHDAVEVFQYMIFDNTLDTVQFFFPDPWPKLRHHKRRIFTKSFIKLILKKLIIGGILHIVTDCLSYAKDIVNIINNIIGYIDISNNSYYISQISSKIVTKFSRKAYLSGNKIFNLIFKCIKK